MEENELMEMEAMETEDFDGTCEEGCTESEGGHGGSVALIVGGLTALTAAAVFVGKKIKDKKDKKAGKPKMKYKLVKVPVEESEDEVVDMEDEDFEEVDL